jgi:uroporphyrinogen-III synthase
MKKILIIRQVQQIHALSKFLEQKNCQIFAEPIFSVQQIFNPDDQLKYPGNNIGAFVITSQNAIYALKKFNCDYNVKIFAVGEKTAQKISEAGFKNISYPRQSCVAKLLKLIKQSHHDKTGLILYLRGNNISFDLQNSLQKSGYNCAEILTYKTIAKKSFSIELLRNIKYTHYDSILIFSQKTLELFFLLAKNHNLLEYFANSSLIVFSQKIAIKAEELAKKNFKFKKIEKFSDNIILKNFYE